MPAATYNLPLPPVQFQRLRPQGPVYSCLAEWEDLILKPSDREEIAPAWRWAEDSAVPSLPGESGQCLSYPGGHMQPSRKKEAYFFSYEVLSYLKRKAPHNDAEPQTYIDFTMWYQKKPIRSKFWRARTYILKERMPPITNAFLAAHGVFQWRELTQCLPPECPWTKSEVSEWVNPGFLREEQRSDKLIFKKKKKTGKKRTDHSLSGYISCALYVAFWLCHIPCISSAEADFCCHQCHLVAVQWKATCWRPSQHESQMPAWKKNTGIWVKPLMSDLIRGLLGRCWKSLWNIPKCWTAVCQMCLLFHFNNQCSCICGNTDELLLMSVTIREVLIMLRSC